MTRRIFTTEELAKIKESIDIRTLDYTSMYNNLTHHSSERAQATDYDENPDENLSGW